MTCCHAPGYWADIFFYTNKIQNKKKNELQNISISLPYVIITLLCNYTPKTLVGGGIGVLCGVS